MKFFRFNLVLAVLAVMFVSGAAFAEFNLRTSFDFSGNIESKSPGYSYYNHSEDINPSATISGEYIRSVVGQYLKIGGGFEFMIPKFRDVDSYSSYHNDAIFFLPLYLSLQTNPVQPVPELFFRLNLGYNIFFYDDSVGSAWDQKGGLYYAFVTGWEFPFGLFVDLTYAFYNASLESSRYINEYDITYSRVAVGVGYKFGRPRN
ncbi:MAG: hypothetical protein LBQ47_04205 [Endomicrobium sp.]|jgi:hypothetical protein|nr:hypothetical protein [Endomicrobium sp.]